jgi:hypothetical protein
MSTFLERIMLSNQGTTVLCLKLHSKLILVLLISLISETFMQIQFCKLFYPACMVNAVTMFMNLQEENSNRITFPLFSSILVFLFSVSELEQHAFTLGLHCLHGRQLTDGQL